MSDVTSRAKELFAAGKPIPADCNSLGIADPANGTVKSLRVVVSVGGHELSLSTRDGGEISIADSERQ